MSVTSENDTQFETLTPNSTRRTNANRLLSRTIAAAVAGVARGTISNWERCGWLDAAKIGPDGAHFYRESDLHAAMGRSLRAPTTRGKAGRTAAAVYRAFAAGQTDREVVMSCAQTPAEVARFRALWLTPERIAIDAKVCAELSELAERGGFGRVELGPAFVELLRNVLARLVELEHLADTQRSQPVAPSKKSRQRSA